MVLNLFRFLSPRTRLGRGAGRKVRSETDTLKRWSQRSPDDCYARDS